MKIIITCIGILSATTAFAGISIQEKLEQGLELTKTVQAVAAENKRLIDQITIELADIELQVRTSNSKNPKLLKSLAECSTAFKKNNDPFIEMWNRHDTQKIANEGVENYSALKVNVARYAEVEACKNCDPEVRKITLDKYASQIDLNLKELKYLSNKYFNKDKELNYLVNRRVCQFDGLFSYNDSQKFTDRKTWNSNGEYEASLSILEVLDPHMSETLSFIADKAPVKVNRTASLISRASSEYTKGQVYININYDYDLLSGVSAVKHPEVANPILIIHRDR